MFKSDCVIVWLQQTYEGFLGICNDFFVIVTKVQIYIAIRAERSDK
ncbi:hypothetical protein ECSTECDG1313_0179 [Escherichia coli STEC_DG131-3]|nr:hypothetical protein ECSTECDG1313_0179 [Escherichia coli STEC_DG131-3]